MASQQTRFLIAAPLLFGVLLGALLLTTRIEEKSLRGLIVDLENADAEEILQAVIDEELTTVNTVEEMTATLEFDDVFSKMTADETMELLYELDLLDHGVLPGNLEQKKAQLPNRGIDMSILQADGVLTAFTSASGGSILKIQDPAKEWKTSLLIKQALEAQFALDPLSVLNAFEPLHLLELFEGRPETSALDAVDRPFGYLWGPTTLDANNMEVYYDPAFPDVGFPDLLVQRRFEPYPNIPEAVNATSAMPEGHRALRFWDMHISIPGTGNTLTRVNPYDSIDVINRSGDVVKLGLPWMDDWEAIMTPRMDEWFGLYKQEWINQFGGDGSDALDSMIFDNETYGSVYTFFVYGRGGALQDENEAELNLAPGTLWNTIEADPRWPALRAKMEARGITDFTGIYDWFRFKDMRQGIWSQVMQEERTAAFNRALYEQVKKHFPNVRFSNYKDSYHNQTLYYGSIHNAFVPHFGIGAHTGNQQQISVYEPDGGYLEYPDRSREYFDPPADFFAFAVEGTGGILTMTLADAITGAYLFPGDTIHVGKGCGAGYDPVARRQVPFDYRLYEGEYPILAFPDPRTILIEMDLARVSSGAQTYVEPWGCNGILNLYTKHSYHGLVQNMRHIRSVTSTSNIPLYPTLSAPGLAAHHGNAPFVHYGELLLHSAVNGAGDIEFWNSTGINAEGNRWISDLMTEVGDIVGYTNSKTLTLKDIDWSGPYTLTGMDSGGRIVWRMTPNNIKYPTSTIISMKPAVIEMQSERLDPFTFTMPNSEIIITENNPSDLGYWIVQSKAAEVLTTTAEAALRIITGIPPQVVEMAGEESTEITVIAGESKTLLFAGFDPLNPPVGRNIETLPIKVQGLTMPEEWKNFAQFVQYPYNIGTAQGEIYVLVLSPEEEDIGNYSATFVTEEGEPLEMTINVSLPEPTP